jgi:hypothetical protein
MCLNLLERSCRSLKGYWHLHSKAKNNSRIEYMNSYHNNKKGQMLFEYEGVDFKVPYYLLSSAIRSTSVDRLAESFSCHGIF